MCSPEHGLKHRARTLSAPNGLGENGEEIPDIHHPIGAGCGKVCACVMGESDPCDAAIPVGIALMCVARA